MRADSIHYSAVHAADTFAGASPAMCVSIINNSADENVNSFISVPAEKRPGETTRSGDARPPFGGVERDRWYDQREIVPL